MSLLKVIKKLQWLSIVYPLEKISILRSGDSNPGAFALETKALPHRHKSALVQQGRTSLVIPTTYNFRPILEIDPITIVLV